MRVPGHGTEVGIDAERADGRREALEVDERERLIRKHQHLMLQPGRTNLRYALGRQRRAQIEPTEAPQDAGWGVTVNGMAVSCRCRAPA